MRRKLAICKRLLSGLLVLVLVLSDFSGASFASYASAATGDNSGVSMGDAPIVDAPVADVPVMEEPVADVPVTEEPGVSEGDAPITGEPAVDEPVADEPKVSGGDAPETENFGNSADNDENGAASYVGDVDGKRLCIDIDSVEQDIFTNEELVAMLQAHAPNSYFSVYIVNTYEGDPVVAADVFNCAVELLNGELDGEKEVTFYLRDDTAGIAYEFTACFAESNSNVCTEDFCVAPNVTFTEDGKVQFCVNGQIPVSNTMNMRLGIFAFQDSEMNAGFRNCFSYLEGNSWYYTFVEADYPDGCWGEYVVEKDLVRFHIDGFGNMVPDEVYEFEKYKGNVNEWEEEGQLRRDLSINPYEVPTSAPLDFIINEALDSHEGEGFDNISIDREYSDKNIISKDILSKAFSLRNPENEFAGVNFGFYKPSESEIDAWCKNIFFSHAFEVTEDMDADAVTMSASKDGIVVKSSALYGSIDEYVDVNYYIGIQNQDASGLMEALGLDVEWQELAYIQNGLCVDSDPHGSANYSYGETGEPEAINFSLWNVNRLALNKEYYAAAITYMEEPWFFGEPCELKTRKTPDEGTTVTWKSSNESVIEIDGSTANPITPGSVTLTATYVSNGQTYREAYCGGCESILTKIEFVNKEIILEMPKDGSWDALTYLDVFYYPTYSSIPNEELLWETSDEGVVTFTDYGEGPFGEIKAVGPGRAVVTATYRDNPEIKAECVVDVCYEVTPDEFPGAVAHLNFDSTLADVELPENWEWAEPSTSLRSYVGGWGSDFPAIYTDAEGRTKCFLIWCEMNYITRMDIWAGDKLATKPITIQAGETVEVVAELCHNMDPSILYQYAEEYDVVWSVTGGTLAEIKDLEVSDEGEKEFHRNFTASDKKGKATITATVINKNTKKVIAKNSVAVNVVTAPVIDWDAVEITPAPDNSALMVKTPVGNYFKLTAKSQSPIVKTGTVKEIKGAEEVSWEIPLTFKDSGYACITITAADSAKSTLNYYICNGDDKVKVDTKKLSINAALIDSSDRFAVTSFFEVKTDEMKVVGDYADIFAVEVVRDREGDELQAKLVLLNENFKGKAKVTVEFPLVDENGPVNTDTHTFDVNVTNVAPKVKITQKTKVNLFYTDAAGAGELTIVSNDGLEISNITLGDYVDKNPAKNAVCDFDVIDNPDAGTVMIELKKGASGKKTKGTLTYTVAGYRKPVTATVTIKTEKKKPTIEASAKSVSFYPEQMAFSADITFREKKTGADYCPEQVKWVASKTDIREISSEGTEVSLKKNTFVVTNHGAGIGVDMYGNNGAGTDTLNLQLQDGNWAEPVSISLKLNVNAKPPVIKLGSSKITLNKNKDVYHGQFLKIPMNYKDNEGILNADVMFVGMDSDSRKVLGSSLCLEYWQDEQSVIARLNGNDLEAKNYNYEIRVKSYTGYETKTKLVVSVVDKKAEVKVTKKGDIDVLFRDTTAITLSGKVVNGVGVPTHGYIKGRDADYFDTYFEDGMLYVKARAGMNYSTKYTYEVTPVFEICQDGGNMYLLEGKTQKIKVKQSKPKVTCTTENGNTIYMQGSGALNLTMTAKVKGDEVEIANVELMNYCGDFYMVRTFEGSEVPEEQELLDKCYTIQYSSSPVDAAKEIYKAGNYTLKLKVTYRDKAGDVKEDTINYKVVLK